MLKATALFAALYGLSAASVELDYGDSKPAKPSMCCTANSAVAGAYSSCKARMKKDDCVNLDDLCYWTECDKVGYCVDPRDDLYFDEELALEKEMTQRRSMLDDEYVPATPEPTPMESGWGATQPKKTPRPTVDRTRTDRPTVDRTRTERPTVDRTRTERPTVDRTRTPRPTPERSAKTPRPTKDRQAKTRRPTVDRTERPNKSGSRTEKPTKNRDKATYIRSSPTKDKTPRPTAWEKVDADYVPATPEPTPQESSGWGSDRPVPCGDSVCGSDEFCCNESCGICAKIGGSCIDRFCGGPIKTPRPTVDHTRTERPTVDRTRTERPTVDHSRTPRPTVDRTRTPRPTPERSEKTPRPTKDRQEKTRRPTVDRTRTQRPKSGTRTERPTKNRDKATYIRSSPTKDKTPRPTAWLNVDANIVDISAEYGSKCPMEGSSNLDCSFEGSCEYGEETCCGETTPALVCRCESNGKTSCIHYDRCLRPECEQTARPTADDGDDNDNGGGSGWGTPEPTPCDGVLPTKPPKTPRPSMVKTPRPTPEKTVKTPKPVMVKTPKPTMPPKTPKPVMVKTPKPVYVKTPKPTMVKTPKPVMIKTPKPTMVKTPKPTEIRTAKPVKIKTPKPTQWSPPKTPRPTKPVKTPKPTAWSPPKTPRPTMPPKTPKPTKRPTRDQTTYLTPAPTPWAKNLNAHVDSNVVDNSVELDYAPKQTPEPTVDDGNSGWGVDKTPEPTKQPKTPRPTPWKAEKTPRPSMVKTPRPTPEKTVKTPKPTMVKTPKPTEIRTPKPVMIKTPKPTMLKTPKPVMIKTPKPTMIRTAKPTKEEKTAKPTKEEKTPRPTKVKTPRPTKEPKTPSPTVDGSGWGEPKPTEPCPVASCEDPCRTCSEDEECVTKKTYFDDDKRCPACDVLWQCKPEAGWGTGKPLAGCAMYVRKGECSEECVWKKGYPPMAFEEDSMYQLQEEFMVNGISVTELWNSDDFVLFFGIGLLIAAVLVFAFRQFMMRREAKSKLLAQSSETRQLIAA